MDIVHNLSLRIAFMQCNTSIPCHRCTCTCSTRVSGEIKSSYPLTVPEAARSPNHNWHFIKKAQHVELKTRGKVQVQEARGVERAIATKCTVACHHTTIPSPAKPCRVPQRISGVILYLKYTMNTEETTIILLQMTLNCSASGPKECGINLGA